jgi:hypothetical protein
MKGPDLHPDLAPLAFLLGTWTGEGEGHYPTIAAFGYGEEAHWWHVGKPMLAYTQRTWSLTDGRPLHSEAGYWRPAGQGRLEVVLAHPTGQVEVEEGTVEGTCISLASKVVARTSTAKEVSDMARHISVEGDLLTYQLSMAAVGLPVQEHLRARLTRAGAPR